MICHIFSVFFLLYASLHVASRNNSSPVVWLLYEQSHNLLPYCFDPRHLPSILGHVNLSWCFSLCSLFALSSWLLLFIYAIVWQRLRSFYRSLISEVSPSSFFLPLISLGCVIFLIFCSPSSRIWSSFLSPHLPLSCFFRLCISSLLPCPDLLPSSAFLLLSLYKPSSLPCPPSSLLTPLLFSLLLARALVDPCSTPSLLLSSFFYNLHNQLAQYGNLPYAIGESSKDGRL